MPDFKTEIENKLLKKEQPMPLDNTEEKKGGQTMTEPNYLYKLAALIGKDSQAGVAIGMSVGYLSMVRNTGKCSMTAEIAAKGIYQEMTRNPDLRPTLALVTVAADEKPFFEGMMKKLGYKWKVIE